MELQQREFNYPYVRYKLAVAGWTTFNVLIKYPEVDPRKWKIIIGVGLENIDCTYKINTPNEEGELTDFFILSDNGNFLEETVMKADVFELVKFLQAKFPKHIPVYPLKDRKKRDK